MTFQKIKELRRQKQIIQKNELLSLCFKLKILILVWFNFADKETILGYNFIQILIN